MLRVTVTSVWYALPDFTARALNVPVTKLSRGERRRLNGLDGRTATLTVKSACAPDSTMRPTWNVTGPAGSDCSAVNSTSAYPRS